MRRATSLQHHSIHTMRPLPTTTTTVINILPKSTNNDYYSQKTNNSHSKQHYSSNKLTNNTYNNHHCDHTNHYTNSSNINIKYPSLFNKFNSISNISPTYNNKSNKSNINKRNHSSFMRPMTTLQAKHNINNNSTHTHSKRFYFNKISPKTVISYDGVSGEYSKETENDRLKRNRKRRDIWGEPMKSSLKDQIDNFGAFGRRRNVKGGSKKFLNYSWHLKGMTVDEALIQMRFSRSRRGYDFYAMIRNAQANAVNQFGMNPDYLVIKRIWVGRAKQPKVLKIGGRGTAKVVRIRHSHLSCKVVEDRDLAARAKSKIQGTRIIAEDRPTPNIIID